MAWGSQTYVCIVGRPKIYVKKKWNSILIVKFSQDLEANLKKKKTGEHMFKGPKNNVTVTIIYVP